MQFKPGRLCNSYIEGRFSIFRNANGNCVVNGTNLHYHFKRMIMREHYGLVKLRVERKDYSGLRTYIDQINDDSAT